jgi:hypothetical protein
MTDHSSWVSGHAVAPRITMFLVRRTAIHQQRYSTATVTLHDHTLSTTRPALRRRDLSYHTLISLVCLPIPCIPLCGESMLRYYAKVSTLSAEERATLKAQQDEQRQKELAASREAQRSIGSSRGGVT